FDDDDRRRDESDRSGILLRRNGRELHGSDRALAAKTRPAVGVVYRSGQRFSLAKQGARGGGDNAIRPGVGDVGDRIDPGVQSASEGTGGAIFWHGPGSLGEGASFGGCEDA